MAVVWLTSAEQTRFRGCNWAPLLDAGDMVLASGPPSRAVSEAALRVFEEGVVSRLVVV